MKCKDEVQCMDEDAICDGKTNCLDGSDEENCADFICLPDHTKCADNLQCIPEQMVCIDTFVLDLIDLWPKDAFSLLNLILRKGRSRIFHLTLISWGSNFVANLIWFH